MMATVSEAAFFEPAAHPDCEAIDVEPKARGKLCSVKYHTEDVIRTIKRYIRDEVNRENAE
jgi:hypothetical protein